MVRGAENIYGGNGQVDQHINHSEPKTQPPLETITRLLPNPQSWLLRRYARRPVRSGKPKSPHPGGV